MRLGLVYKRSACEAFSKPIFELFLRVPKITEFSITNAGPSAFDVISI